MSIVMGIGEERETAFHSPQAHKIYYLAEGLPHGLNSYSIATSACPKRLWLTTASAIMPTV